jgi:hypothetical protein
MQSVTRVRDAASVAWARLEKRRKEKLEKDEPFIQCFPHKSFLQEFQEDGIPRSV